MFNATSYWLFVGKTYFLTKNGPTYSRWKYPLMYLKNIFNPAIHHNVCGMRTWLRDLLYLPVVYIVSTYDGGYFKDDWKLKPKRTK